MRKILLIFRSRCEIAKHIINSGCCGRKNDRDSDSKLLVFEIFQIHEKAKSKLIGNWSLRKKYSFEIKCSGRRSRIPMPLRYYGSRGPASLNGSLQDRMTWCSSRHWTTRLQLACLRAYHLPTVPGFKVGVQSGHQIGFPSHHR
jgi:hypothetical protein